MPDHIIRVNPTTSEKKALIVEYEVPRPEASYIHAVASALANAKSSELKTALVAMIAAGFDPAAIRLEIPNNAFSSRPEPMLHWALYHSSNPRRLFRTLVEGGLDASTFINRSIARDNGPSTLERWAWKLVLSRLDATDRLAAHALQDMPRSPSTELSSGLDVKDPAHVGSALHQAVLSGKIELLPELLSLMGQPNKDLEPAGSFSVARAIFWRISQPAGRSDWPELFQAVSDDALLEMIGVPTKAYVKGTSKVVTLLALSLELAQSPNIQPGARALEVLVDRLEVRLAPALIESGYARTPQMKAPIFDRLDDVVFRHNVIDPRERLLEQRVAACATPRRPRPRG